MKYDGSSKCTNTYVIRIVTKSVQKFTINKNLTKFLYILNETIHTFYSIHQIPGLLNAVRERKLIKIYTSMK